MSRFRPVHILLAALLAGVPVAAFAAGIIETSLDQTLGLAVVTAVGMILTAVLTWAAATSERFAAPARAKPAQDRTLADKAAIEIDKRIDALNIRQLETFISRFVLSRIDKVLSGPLLDPMRQADEFLVDALDAFKRRNPDLAAQMKIDPTSMRELIAAGIGSVRKDALAAALARAGVPAQAPAPLASLPEEAPPTGSSTTTVVFEGPEIRIDPPATGDQPTPEASA